MRATLLLLSVIVGCSNVVGADEGGPSFVDLVGVRTQNDDGAGLGGAGGPAAQALVIPPRCGNAPTRFTIASATATTVAPRGAACFDVTKDTADFTNFASASVVDDRLVTARQVNGGTCYGMAYFTSVWYERLVRPVQQGRAATPFRVRDLRFGTWDGLTRDLSRAGTAPFDGVELVMQRVAAVHHDRPGTFPFSEASMARNLEPCRMRAMSGGAYRNDMVRGAIAHHRDQCWIDELPVDPTDGDDLDRGIRDIRDAVEAHGSRVFTFRTWGDRTWGVLWRKNLCAHAVLVYRVSEVQAQGPDGVRRPALKLHLYDPNVGAYRDPRPAATGEGYGTYLLYFPEAKRLTFSRRMQQIYGDYGLQTDEAFVDGTRVTVAHCDVYEGHPIQERIAREAFIDGWVGRGRVLSDDELERVEREGRLRVD